MSSLLLDSPTPDFDEFVRVLKGEQLPGRAQLVEIGMDDVVMQAIAEQHLHEAWPAWPAGAVTPPEAYYRLLVTLYYRLGYDYAPIWASYANHPERHVRIADDTADAFAREKRHWLEEGRGLITNQADFEQFPWDAIQPVDTGFEFASRHLPPGMKLVALTTFFEHIYENLLGYEGLFFLMYDDPPLVEEVFQCWGEIVVAFYESIIQREDVGAIFHADDMGYKTSTLISPADLRRLVLPWHKRFAALAHDCGKPFFLHSCGNLFKTGLMDDLIDDVGIDGLHSFQDVILPVSDFKTQFGQRTAALGGVDMDKLARLDETSLRATVRHILHTCMPGGRFALGAGNTIANYVPLENYRIMLEEARNWRPASKTNS